MTHPCQPMSRPQRKAFSLIEMLVVIGVIVILAGILIPVAFRASRSASLTKLAADLQVVGSALEAYRADFGDYPRLNPVASRSSPDRGSVLLAWSLIGPYDASLTSTSPGDGADGPGFRIRAGQGKVYGPYIPADRFRTLDLTVGSTVYKQLADGFLSPILYYPGKSGARGTPGSPNYLANADNASYNPNDNPELSSGALGDRLTKANFNGPFILWSAGPDQTFGTKDDVSNVP